MSKTKHCPVCDSSIDERDYTYTSTKTDIKTGKRILVDIKEFYCSNKDCGFSWLPADQEKKIETTVALHSRYDLKTDEIKMIRESLPFENKFQAASFLCLNEKAFTRWELEYSDPNRAYDLLLRLAAHSHSNMNFIKHLHKTDFKFDPCDYQTICDKKKLNWNFQVLNTGEFTIKINTPIVVSSTSNKSLTYYNDRFDETSSTYELADSNYTVELKRA